MLSHFALFNDCKEVFAVDLILLILSNVLYLRYIYNPYAD